LSRDPAESASSLARVLLSAGQAESARALAEKSDDAVLLGLLSLESHDFASARRLLDAARRDNPFDPRTASARGRLAFLERRFGDAVADLLEAALLRPDGLPDATEARFLKAARALAPDKVAAWPEAVSAAAARLETAARSLSPDLTWPDRTNALVRALVSRSIGPGAFRRFPQSPLSETAPSSRRPRAGSSGASRPAESSTARETLPARSRSCSRARSRCRGRRRSGRSLSERRASAIS
jgi:hypothetical protein